MSDDSAGTKSEQPIAQCLDCGLPYEQFPLDVVLPRPQWLTIHPADGGLLCASCIVKRAALVPGAMAVHAIIEIAPAAPRACETCAHLRRFELSDEILTCPVVNFRIHQETAKTFSCSFWQAMEEPASTNAVDPVG